MKTKLLLFLFYLVSVTAFAQCVEGDCKEGFGRLLTADYTYIGFFKEGKYHGMAKLEYYNGDVYKGSFLNGARHGVGIMTIKATNESMYAQFENDLLNGFVFHTKDGEFIQAAKYEEGKEKKKYTDYNKNEYVNGCRGNCMKGFGLRAWASNDYFYGFWWGSMPDAVGIRVFPSGATYRGGMNKADREGFGEYTYTDGAYYSGEWKKNKREGYGVYVYADGRELKGIWKKDEIVERM